MTIKKSDYKYADWKTVYGDDKVDLKRLSVHKSWKKLFDKLYCDERFAKIEEYLTKIIQRDKNILPYPDLVFKAFQTDFKEIKVVIIGQDPYIKIEEDIPQAMGLSFSVPKGIKTPSSLQNIYKNLLKFNHIKSIPKHGNLEHLLDRGVFLLNSSLTVQENISNSHQKYWTWFTDKVIEYLVKHNSDVTFVLWGKNAIDKVALIGNSNYVASSHPSGLSCNKPCGKYMAFEQCDFAKELDIDWKV